MVMENNQLLTIQEEWDIFAKNVFRGMTPSEVQVNEMRKAFFAGALIMLTSAMRSAELPDNEAEKWITARLREGRDFGISTIIAELMREHS